MHSELNLCLANAFMCTEIKLNLFSYKWKFTIFFLDVLYVGDTYVSKKFVSR